MKIFYSWQSDLPNSENRNFIQGCIDKTIKKFKDIIEITADRDTKDKLGAPDITKTIFEKIDECDLFVADISITNKSKCKFLRTGSRPTPNPNVLIELGYAVKTLNWDRIICVYNTDYSDLDALPFDLRQHRITSYSLKNNNKSKVRDELVGILSNTINQLIDGGNAIRVKEGQSYHTLLGYDLCANQISKDVVINPIFNRTGIRDMLILEAENLINRISAYKIEDCTKDEHISKEITLSGLIGEYTPVIINEKRKNDIITQVKDILGKDLDDNFFCVGQLKKKLNLVTRGYDYQGSDSETSKYDDIESLESKLTRIQAFDIYIQTFKDFSIIPLALKNTSTILDENINIFLTIEGDGFELITPSQDLIIDDLNGCEGFIYEYGFIEGLFRMPENQTVKYDEKSDAINYPDFHPVVDLWDSSPDYDAEDYGDGLKEYIASPSGENTFEFTISSLQAGETKWLDGVLLLKQKSKNVSIGYTIRSNNSDGTISGHLNKK